MADMASNIAGLTVDDAMSELLNSNFPADESTFECLTALRGQDETERWLMTREHGGIRLVADTDS